MKTRKIDKLTDMILELSEDPEHFQPDTRSSSLLAQVAAAEMAHAQENAISNGLSPGRLWHIWQQNRAKLPDQASKLRRELPVDHILRRVLAEHEMLLCFLSDLTSANEQIGKLSFAGSENSHIRKLGHVASHLVAARQHREREEQVILPVLRQAGYGRLLHIIDLQHMEINRGAKRLYNLVKKVDNTQFEDFKKQIDELITYLVPTMRIHIFIESNIIFPLALEQLDDPGIWQRMKEVSDDIGYCGYDAHLLEMDRQAD